MSVHQNILIEKLNQFKKKYDLNQFIKGALIVLAGLGIFYILIAFLEYFAYFNTFVRSVLFFGYLFFALFVIVKLMIIPTLRYFNILETISNEKAANLIGQHFPEISDKLLNTLQLNNQAENSNNDLLLASIDQKIKSMSPFSFTNVVNFKSSFKKYGKFAILPILVIGTILLFQSHIITKPTQRLINFNQHFEKEAPFYFKLLNKNLEVSKHSDLNLIVETYGKDLPQEVFASIEGKLIKMMKVDKSRFEYNLTNVNKPLEIFFTDKEFNSQKYQINALPNPVMSNFSLQLVYPSYIKRQNETLQNIGDVQIPQGTTINWKFNTVDVEELYFSIYNQNKILKSENSIINHKEYIKNSTAYHLLFKNNKVPGKDTIHFNIETLEDRHPNIVAEKLNDSINPFVIYFYGKTEDDYGISRLTFNYYSKNSQKINSKSVPIGTNTEETFYYKIDTRDLISEKGNEIEYYFEVWDNDAVNGKKSSKSQIFSAFVPDKNQLRNEAESSSRSLKKQMQDVMKEVDQWQKKSQTVSKELSEKKNLDWQSEQSIKDLIKDKKEIDKKLEKIKQENDKINEKDKLLNEKIDEELLKKQQEIQKMFEELMSPEMKELLKKLEEELKKQNKESIEKQLENMRLNNKDLKNELDRSLEQFKQMELEKKINDQINRLNELAEKQEKLSEQSKDKNANQEELKKQQDEINKEFKDIEKEQKQIDQKNNELEVPMNLDKFEKEEKEINESLENSKENLSKKQNNKASQNQKNAADKMKEMAEKMQENLDEAQEQQDEEDMQALRQILENLIALSHEQENLMQEMKQLRGYSPKFVELSSNQQRIKDVFSHIEDSLLSLAKRQVQIKSYVTKEVNAIKNNMNKSIDNFSKIQTSQGSVNQQYAMTGMNNLATMLSESLKQMQNQQNEKKDKKSNQSCKNPGNKPKPGQSGKPKDGKPKMDGSGKKQQSMTEQLKKMQENMKNGVNPNAKEFAIIAAKQEALRRELEKIQKNLKEEGKEGSLGNLKETQKMMEEIEKDLVNKKITPETIRRMEEIETRLLEHEKAEREQEQDNQREGEQAKETTPPIPPSIKEYLEKKAKEIELIRKVPAEMKPYYQEQVKQYFKKVGNG